MTAPVPIPADVDLPDRVLAGLTARQVAILAGTAAVVYLGWLALGAVVPLAVYAVLAAPVAVAGIALAVGRREGIGLAELAGAAIAYRLAPRRMATAAAAGAPVPGWVANRAGGPGPHPGMPERGTPLRLPARGDIGAAGPGPAGVGVIDLGRDGLAVVAAASTVNFALRTESEQHALVGCFARLLHAVSGPMQILIRAQRLDLGPALAELAAATARLPHPALRAAAADHYHYLAELASTELLARQVLVVLREPPGPSHAHTPAAANRLVQRLGEVHRCLAPAEITVTPLPPAAAHAVLATACDPDRPLPAAPTAMAAPDQIITTPPGTHRHGPPGRPNPPPPHSGWAA